MFLWILLHAALWNRSFTSSDVWLKELFHLQKVYLKTLGTASVQQQLKKEGLI